MNLNTLCSHNVAMIAPSAGVIEAARQMREHHVGDLIVVEQRGGLRVPVGILTDRDIAVGVVADGISPSEIKVADVMSADVLKVNVENGLEFALREMRRVGVRRAPVVDDSGELIGVLSIDDMIDHLAEQLGNISDIVRMGRKVELERRP